MAKRRNTKAEILADIERVRMEKAAAREEARRLIELGAAAKVVEEEGEDGRKHHVVRARHLDCFALLLKGDAFIQARASVDWLEALIRDASGENAQERRPDHIRASTVGAPGQNVTQRMIEASRELEVVEANLRPWEARLLFELLKPDAARLGRWHDVAKRVTGEVNAQAQGAAVRLAAQNLQWVETRMPILMREYWERKAA